MTYSTHADCSSRFPTATLERESRALSCATSIRHGQYVLRLLVIAWSGRPASRHQSRDNTDGMCIGGWLGHIRRDCMEG